MVCCRTALLASSANQRHLGATLQPDLAALPWGIGAFIGVRFRRARTGLGQHGRTRRQYRGRSPTRRNVEPRLAPCAAPRLDEGPPRCRCGPPLSTTDQALGRASTSNLDSGDERQRHAATSSARMGKRCCVMFENAGPSMI